ARKPCKVEYLDDVLAVQARCRRRLPEEALGRLDVHRDFRPHHLDRAKPLQLLMVRQEDITHPALAELLLDAVLVPDPVAMPERCCHPVEPQDKAARAQLSNGSSRGFGINYRREAGRTGPSACRPSAALSPWPSLPRPQRRPRVVAWP